MKNRRAPLAEVESTRVENSPAVELPPIGFDRLTSSPGQRRRAQTVAASRVPQITPTTTTFMHDANGNIVSMNVSENLSGSFLFSKLCIFFQDIFIKHDDTPSVNVT